MSKFASGSRMQKLLINATVGVL